MNVFDNRNDINRNEIDTSNNYENTRMDINYNNEESDI